MKVLPVERQLRLPSGNGTRTVGIHVSGLIRCIAAEVGVLKAEYVEDLSLTDVREITDPVAVLRMSIGLAWEEWYIPHIDIEDHPGELCIDGIYMTHDGESVDVIITQPNQPEGLIVHEVKATYKSTRTVGEDLTSASNWMWLTQLKAYCKGVGTNHAMLHVLFLCGDYARPITPKLKVWFIEFTDEEIAETWELMIDYMQHRLNEVAQ